MTNETPGSQAARDLEDAVQRLVGRVAGALCLAGWLAAFLGAAKL